MTDKKQTQGFNNKNQGDHLEGVIINYLKGCIIEGKIVDVIKLAPEDSYKINYLAKKAPDEIKGGLYKIIKSKRGCKVKGRPDLIVLKKEGVVVFLEVKSGNATFTKEQSVYKHLLLSNKFNIFKVGSIEDVKKVLNI